MTERQTNYLAQIAFYLFTAFLICCFFSACAPGREVVQIIKGDKGDTGEPGLTLPCVAEQAEAGALLSCPGQEPVFIAAVVGPQGPQGIPGVGTQGPQGEPGEDGKDGQDAPPSQSNATLRDYPASMCSLIIGTSSYVKKQQNNNYKLYTASSCASNTAFAEVSQGEAYWAAPNVYATHAGSVLRVITFGGN